LLDEEPQGALQRVEDNACTQLPDERVVLNIGHLMILKRPNLIELLAEPLRWSPSSRGSDPSRF
jgi:hypothetical protein